LTLTETLSRAIDRGEHQDHARPLRPIEQLAEAEHDRALILVEDLDRAEQIEREDDDDDQNRRNQHKASIQTVTSA
jgi:hypothetical protein